MNELLQWANSPIRWSGLAIFLLLVVATLIVEVLRRVLKDRDWSELVLRIRSWWVLVGIFLGALLIGRTFSVVLFALVSFLALKEYLALIPTRQADRRVMAWLFLSIPFQYYWVYIGWYGMFIIFIPVYMFLLLPTQMVLIGETKGYLQAVGTLHWGAMCTIFCLSHVSYFFALPPEKNPAGGGAALVLFLSTLTQLNDVAQYVWGKLFGKRKVVPTVSPNKTVAGFLGGVCTTTLLATIVGPYLTPMTPFHSLLAGLIIGIGGFIGDVSVSALKRDVGVKDAGSSIPGHGGILDRVNSLYYTAPLFFHFVYYLYY